MTNSNRFIAQIPEFADIIKTAAHVDVKTVETDMLLRCFIAALLNYRFSCPKLSLRYSGW